MPALDRRHDLTPHLHQILRERRERGGARPRAIRWAVEGARDPFAVLVGLLTLTAFAAQPLLILAFRSLSDGAP